MAEQKSTLTSKEQGIFDAEWDPFLTRHFRSREVIDIFQDHKASIQESIEIAKYELESDFGGVNARTNEFGWMPIMPNFLLATSAPAYSTSTWNRYITTANVSSRWIDWIGSSSASLALSKYGTMILLGFYDPVEEPKVGGVMAEIKGVKYPMWYYEDMIVDTDYPIYELPTPIVVEKEQEIYLQTYCLQAGLDKTRPVGLYFIKGSEMRNKTAYAQT